MKRSYLNKLDDPAYGIDPEVANRAVVALARFACDGRVGRVQGDPVFEEVTEGRQRCWTINGKRTCYSGCADLAHWVLWNLAGKPDASLSSAKGALRALNRAEGFGWVVGRNVALLVQYAQPQTRYRPGDTFEPKPGSILLIGEHGQEHIAIVEELIGDRLYTFDYGQCFQPKFGAPSQYGGKGLTRRVTVGPDGRPWVYAEARPGRPVVLAIDTGEYLCRVADAVGELPPAFVPDDFVV